MSKLRDIAAMATALQTGAKARGLGIEAENQAAEVVIRAERAIGSTLLRLKDEGVYANPALHGSKGGKASVKHGQFVGVNDKGVADGQPLVTLSELGLDQTAAARFQNMARIPDDEFERMLSELKALGGRIAKVNFYRSPKGTEPTERPVTETPTDVGFSLFRGGAMRLLGWEVGEDGTAGPTRNGLMGLSADELGQVKALCEALARAYGEAVRARAA